MQMLVAEGAKVFMSRLYAQQWHSSRANRKRCIASIITFRLVKDGLE
jgi:hypothetical protein